MLVGEELHDPTLKEKGSHLLVLGTTRALRYTREPQN